jgi:hypothetical protein
VLPLNVFIFIEVRRRVRRRRRDLCLLSQRIDASQVGVNPSFLRQAGMSTLFGGLEDQALA